MKEIVLPLMRMDWHFLGTAFWPSLPSRQNFPFSADHFNRSF